MVCRSMLLLFALCSLAAAQGEWKDGRASFYGVDGWSIHHGNCGFGYQWPEIATGWDVAALADAAPEFSGSCGRCFEVKCDHKYLHDGYNNGIDRKAGICKDDSKTVVVRTVDSCPCYYPNNQYSNRRWCCGDNGYTHFDLSIWAFEKLAEIKWGVIGLKYRQVPCSYKSSNPAPTPTNPTPGEAPPSGAKRPDEYTYVKRSDSAGQPQGAVKAVPTLQQAFGAPQVSYDSMFQGGGAFTINPASTSSAYAASKVLGSSFASSSASASSYSSSSASASASSGSGNSWSSSFASGGGGSIMPPLVMAFSDKSNGGGCNDVPPPGGFTCDQQKAFGKCEEKFVKDGGYCMKTCGHCPDEQQQQQQASSGSSPGPCTDLPPPGGFTCEQQKAFGKCQEKFVKEGRYCMKTCGQCQEQQQQQQQQSSNGATQQQSSSGSPSGPSDSSSGVVYYKGFQGGWGSWSYSASFSERSKSGVNGDQAVCGVIYNNGAFQTGNNSPGSASGKTALQFWVDTAADQLIVNLGSQSATCTAKLLSSVGASEKQSNFTKYYFRFSDLGCPFGADQVTRMTLANAKGWNVYTCVSDVRFI